MAFPGNSSNYPSEITQLSSSDPVAADGSTPNDGLGKANAQARELADRTAWLKNEINKLVEISASLNADMVDGLGRNLFEVLRVNNIPDAMAALRVLCNNNGEIDDTGIPQFGGLQIGDYLDGLDLSGVGPGTLGNVSQAPMAWDDTTKNNRLVLSGLNTYKGYGPSEATANHILFTFRNCIAAAAMNNSGLNTGGYRVSDLRKWLEGSDGNLLNSVFGNELNNQFGGNYLYTLYLSHSIKGSTGTYMYTVWPPTEIEVMGYQTYGDELSGYNTNVQFPIYQRSGAYRIKRLDFQGSGDQRWYWWLQTPYASDTSSFCLVDSSGGVGGNFAGDSYDGVSLAFCVR